MTNEEKIEEIRLRDEEDWELEASRESPNISDYCCDAMLEMAEWKDEQLKEQRRIIRNHYQNWAEEQIAHKAKEMIPRTQLDAFNQFQFDCDTPKLLKEIADFSGARIYRPVWSIFQNLLAQVAVRATELHDPVLDALMLRMGMYDVKANERRELVKKCEKIYKEGDEK